MLQDSRDLSMRNFKDINKEYLKNIEKYQNTESLKLTNGKDALLILKNIVKKFGINKDNIDKVLWMYFNKDLISNNHNLNIVINILQNK